MQAPNKIFIQQDMINNIPLEQKEFDDDVEYIRKDALLEWAKKELKRYSEDTQWEFGYSRALRDLIDKLNSM